MNPPNSPDSIPNTEGLPQPRAGKSVFVMGIVMKYKLESAELNPSEQTASPTEKQVLKAFAGMMQSCHRIRNAVRKTREQTH